MKIGAFKKNIFKMISSTILGKLITIISMPLLTRLYSAESFGYMNILLSMTIIGIPIFHFGYAYYLPLVKNEKVRIKIINSILSLIIILTCVFLSLIILSDLLFDLDVNYKLLYISVVACFLSAIYESLYQGMIRKKDFNVISIAIITRNLSNSLIKILSFLAFPKLGILFGPMCQDVLSNIYLIKKSNYKVKLGSLLVLKRFIIFPLYRLPSHLLLIISGQIPILMVGYFYNVKEVGYLGLALNVLMIPASMVANSLSQVFYSEILSLGKKNIQKTISLMKKLNLTLIAFSIIPLFVLCFYAGDLFVLFFGKDWYLAGHYSKILCFFVLFQSMAIVNIKVIHFLNLQKELMLINFVRLVCALSIFLVLGYLDFPLEVVLFIYSILMSLYYLFISYYSYRLLVLK